MLKKISFGDGFNQPINNVRWPHSLVSLYISPNYMHSTQSVPSRIEIRLNL